MQVCFFCGSANGPDAKVCHSCSQPLGSDEEQTSDNGVAHDIALTECPYCGNEVGPDDDECGNCKSTLVSADPLDRPAPKSHERDITSRYDDFADKVQQVRDGRMTRKQFSTWLDTMNRSMSNQRDRYVELIRTSGYYEFGSDEVDMGMTGILQYEEALEMMTLFAKNEDEEEDMGVLDAALRKMWHGNEMCNEAMRINRDFRAKLEEDWGYM